MLQQQQAAPLFIQCHNAQVLLLLIVRFTVGDGIMAPTWVRVFSVHCWTQVADISHTQQQPRADLQACRRPGAQGQ